MYWLDYERLKPLQTAHAVYANAKPFPHIVMDNFLPEKLVKKLQEDFPRQDSDYWHRKDVATSKKLDSRRLDKEVSLPPSIRQLMWELNGAGFLLLLTQLTGIQGLSADPYLEGAGPHMIETGGFLKVHPDFNLHPYTKLHRRLNLLIYLNDNWNPEWGGQLELWKQDMSACAKRVDPIANRAVIFTTDDDSFHGHPRPLQTPQGVCRRSLALYYYATPDQPMAAHSTIYRKS
jgi:hypothetical protein